MFPGSCHPLAGSHCGHHLSLTPMTLTFHVSQGTCFRLVPRPCVTLAVCHCPHLFNVCRADACGRIVPGTHAVPTIDFPLMLDFHMGA